MNRKVGFDNEKYLKEQSESILKSDLPVH